MKLTQPGSPHPTQTHTDTHSRHGLGNPCGEARLRLALPTLGMAGPIQPAWERKERRTQSFTGPEKRSRVPQGWGGPEGGRCANNGSPTGAAGKARHCFTRAKIPCQFINSCPLAIIAKWEQAEQLVDMEPNGASTSRGSLLHTRCWQWLLSPCHALWASQGHLAADH